MPIPMRASVTASLGLSAALLAAACTQSASVSSAPAPAEKITAPQAHIAWDWTGIIGTGQSLEVGQYGTPVASKTQPYHNLMLATGNLQWPIDPNNDALAMAPLIEPMNRNGASGYPNNVDGETPHSAMANEITALAMAQFGRDLVSVHTEVGENGKGMSLIKKGARPQGTNGRAYDASLFETKAITRLAKAAGKTFGVGAIIITHGETDNGSSQYEQWLRQMWTDYNADIPAITGQKEKILMIVSQQHGIGNPSAATQGQWKVGVDYPDDIVCSGPKYQYRSNEGLHLTTEGYRELGEKYGEVYYQRVVLENKWMPLQPTAIDHAGATLTIHFHVPVGPLAWDTEMDPPHANMPEWKAGKGFEVTGSGGRVTIQSAEIKGDTVVLTCAADPGPGARVSYAMTGETRRRNPTPGFQRWGLLKDSDPFKGSSTGTVQANYCVAFTMSAS